MAIDLRELFQLYKDELNDRMEQSVLEAIHSGALDGFDYLKFKHSVTNLMKMDLDERTAIKSAFTTAQSMGLDKEKLVQTISHYENIVQNEMVKFTDALRNQISKNIDGLRLDQDKLEKIKQENQRKIEQLQRENDIIGQNVTKLAEELAANEAKIVATRENFKHVCDTINDKIKADKSLYSSVL